MQYIFRGLTADNKWVYGSLIQRTDGIGKLSLIEVQDKEGEITVHQVKDDSVGVALGCKDKNGIMVFVGDVIKFLYNDEERIEPVVSYSPSIVYVGSSCNFYAYYLFSATHPFNAEVIGNIYDNPELLTPAK